MRLMRPLVLLLASLAAVLAWPAAAQDIPGRVGRLAWTEGQVALYQDPERGWDDAYLNSPITSRNSVWTEPGARAEVQVGAAALRLDSASQLDIARLDDTVLEATLEQGEMSVRIRHFFAGDTVRLSTPQATFLLEAAGHYRLESDPDNGQSRLAVFDGGARLEEGGNARIGAGQSLVVWGGERPSYAVQQAYTTDFDRWAMARDEHWIESRTPTYVSYEMTGYEDLDTYGAWSNDPTYGAVWYPTAVAADWAPYREGRWAYVSPWGWTWVDAEPWGYAPFHYGRWVQVRDRWAWCPGQRVDRPAWAPALVGFVGGAGFAASGGSGAVVGWYPLAPSEPYRPWYTAGSSYVKRVNSVVVNVPAQVAREHRDANRERGVTAVRREALVTQQPIARARVQVAPAQARNAAPAPTAAAVLPSASEVRQAHARNVTRGPRPAGPPAPIARNSAQAAPAAPAARESGSDARPQFAKPHAAPKPAPREAAAPPANLPLARATPPRPEPPATREAQQQQPRAAQQAQQQQDRAHQAQERVAQQQRDAAQRQQQERTTRDAQQQRNAQQAQREAQQQEQERATQQAQREAQQQQQQQRNAQQEQRNARQAQQAQQAQREAQQQQQQQRVRQQAQREAQQQQQQQQRNAQQEQRNAQQAQQAQREAQQQQQQQQQRARQQAQREAQQQQQQRAAQQAQQQQQQQRAAQQAQQQQQQRAEQAQREAQQAQPQAERGRQREQGSQARAEPDRKEQGHGEGG